MTIREEDFRKRLAVIPELIRFAQGELREGSGVHCHPERSEGSQQAFKITGRK